MLTDKLHEKNKYCTGCGACDNICPVSAITMTEDSEGFFVPEINGDTCTGCMMCESVCPQLNPTKENSVDPDCYALRAEDEIVAKSASGGAFTIYADYVFEKGGVVCGAAYDQDHKGVSHIIISSSDEMWKLRGSKYVFSKPGNIYKDVKERLQQGQWVLFSGTPCQVAALKNFLMKDYETLLTIDILCGGVPSEKIFSKYISEISEGREVTSVDFRPKEYGWHYSGIKTEFENGDTHIVHSVRDPYLKGFLNWLFVGKACADCQFAPPARQGDISIGDFWNIDRYDETLDYDDGVSCCLINNEKAEKLFNEVKQGFSLVKKVPVSFLKRFNRLQQVRKHHLARSRFFDLIDRGFSIKKAVDYSLNWKFDIALTGCWSVDNYGGSLTYYSLYCLLKDMGHTVIMVERRSSDPKYYKHPAVARMFSRSPYPFFDVSKVYKSKEEQEELNNRVRMYMLGSDQIWNYRLFPEESINSYSLDYAKEYRKKIAYSSSFGSVKFIGNEEQKQLLKQLLDRFDSISVREKGALDILKEDFEIDSEWVLDPLFLCDENHYYELIDRATARVKGQYLFSYIIHPSPFKKGIEKVADILNIGLINTVSCDPVVRKDEAEHYSKWSYPYEDNCSIENWLYYIVNSAFIITDSFHAVCLALIFKKQFVFVQGMMNNEYGLDRISSLLNELKLSSRIVKSVEEMINNNIISELIDYDIINKEIDIMRSNSLLWLKKAIYD